MYMWRADCGGISLLDGVPEVTEALIYLKNVKYFLNFSDQCKQLGPFAVSGSCLILEFILLFRLFTLILS